MKNIITIIITSVCILFQYSIIYSQPNLNKIDFERGIREIKNVPLSEIATNIQYIPMETNIKCLLGQSPRIQITDHYIFISTDMEHLYRFSRNGKFLNEIGRVGRGPGEYVKIINYIIDEKNENIYVNDSPFGKKIICYNFEGKYLQKFKLDMNSMVIEFFYNDIMFHNMYYTHREIGKQTTEIGIYNKRGDIIKLFSSTSDPLKKYGISIIPAIGYTFQNVFHYKAPFCDTLYSISNLKIKSPEYFFDMGKAGRPIDADELKNRKIQNTVAIMDICETPRFLLFTCTGEKNRQNILYNKTDRSVSNVTWRNTAGFEEDISGGLPFWPYLYSDSGNEKLLVDFVLPQDLIAHMQTEYSKEKSSSSIQTKTLKEMCDKMSESDNLILRIVTLK